MVKSKISAVAAALVMVTGAAVADTQVVGQVSATPNAVVVANSVKNNVGASEVPYVQGDVVSTSADSTAKVRLSSGMASFVAAENTSMQVVNANAGEIALNQGAVEVTAAAGFPVTVTSAAGTFEISADNAIDAVVVAQGDEFAVVSRSGDLVVDSQGVLSKVQAGEAFAYNGEAHVFDAQAAPPAGFKFLGLVGSQAVLAAGLAGASLLIVGNEVFIEDDDDDDGSPQ